MIREEANLSQFPNANVVSFPSSWGWWQKTRTCAPFCWIPTCIIQTPSTSWRMMALWSTGCTVWNSSPLSSWGKLHIWSRTTRERSREHRVVGRSSTIWWRKSNVISRKHTQLNLNLNSPGTFSYWFWLVTVNWNLSARHFKLLWCRSQKNMAQQKQMCTNNATVCRWSDQPMVVHRLQCLKCKTITVSRIILQSRTL